MKYSIEKFNDKIDFISVSNEKGLDVIFSNFGAGVYSLRFNKAPMILEFQNKEDWLYAQGYYGKTLGRVCGRLKCQGELDGIKYNLKEKVANHCLHGGDLNSLSYRPFKYSVKEYKNKICVSFLIKLKNLENGFLNKANIKVVYEVYENNNFKVKYLGTTDKVTLMNLTNHFYFNFNSSNTINDYYLKINADKCSVIDDDTFIIGYNNVPDILNFTKATKLKARLDKIEKELNVKTIDHTYLFNEVNSKIPQIVFKNKEFKVSVYTSYPACNFYGEIFGKPLKIVGIEDDNLKRRSLAIEPQLVNYDFDSIILRKDQKFNHFILYKFKDLRK